MYLKCIASYLFAWSKTFVFPKVVWIILRDYSDILLPFIFHYSSYVWLGPRKMLSKFPSFIPQWVSPNTDTFVSKSSILVKFISRSWNSSPLSHDSPPSAAGVLCPCSARIPGHSATSILVHLILTVKVMVAYQSLFYTSTCRQRESHWIAIDLIAFWWWLSLSEAGTDTRGRKTVRWQWGVG